MANISPATPTDIELVEVVVVQSISVSMDTGMSEIFKLITQTIKDTGEVHSVRTFREEVETAEFAKDLKTLIDYAVKNAPDKSEA
jgi:uncharacterized protein YaiI (UPF0178 family)